MAKIFSGFFAWVGTGMVPKVTSGIPKLKITVGETENLDSRILYFCRRRW
jgi:hypothetical protein